MLREWKLAVASAAAGLALAAVAVTLAGPWDAGQRTAERDRAAAEEHGDTGAGEGTGGASQAGQNVLDPAQSSGRAPARAAVTQALGSTLDDSSLGPGGATAAVVDVATGEQLYSDRADEGMAPASTVKLVTAAAALRTLGGEHRLRTTTVWDEDAGRVVLVGGGDPTLSDHDLRDLAERTAASLADQGVTTVRVGYDVSLYATERHTIGVNDNIALVTPLQVDAGRLDGGDSGPAPRAADPAPDAAQRFADYLQDAGRDAGLRVTGGQPASGAAPQDAGTLAVHRSAPVSSLVERMLTDSDNDLAEALGRHVALATGHEGTFRGVSRALAGVVADLGLPSEGVRFADASGLDREGRVTASLLAGLLTLAADDDHPGLRPVLTGLPVAGFTGTLSSRYGEGEVGAGVVRAKTGTLTGVNTLAGTVTTEDGRVLAFAFLAGGTADGDAAESALDAAATALATCACG